MDKITEQIKLIVTISAVTIGVTNLILFPIIDLIFPQAHLVSDVAPFLATVLGLLR